MKQKFTKPILQLLLFCTCLFTQQVKAQNNCFQTNAAAYLSAPSISANSFSGAQDFTLEAWVMPSTFGSNIYSNTIIAKELGGANNAGYVLRCGNGGNVDFTFGSGSSSNWESVTTTNTPLATFVWHHIAAVKSGTTISIYIDGAYNISATASSSTIYGNTTDLTIGESAAFTGRKFDGKIDEVRIWNVARSQANIQADMIAEICTVPNSLIAYYKLNEASGNSYTDYASGNTATKTGSGTQGWPVATYSPFSQKPTVTATATQSTICAGALDTLTGGGAITYTWSGSITNGLGFATPSTTTTYTVTGTNANGCINTASKTITINALPTITSITTVPSNPSICLGDSITINSATTTTTTTNHTLSFDGNVDYVNLGNMTQLSNTAHFTIECMVFANVISFYKNIFSKRVSPSNTIQLQFDVVANGQKLVVHIGDGVNNAEVYTNADFTTNIWHHVAVVYDGNGATNSDKVKIYVDGNLMPTSTYMSGIIPITTGTNTVPCLVGSENTSPTNLIAFNGKLNDLRIWSTSRTAADIAASNNSCISNTTGLIAQYKFDESTGTSTANTLGSSYTGTLNNFITPSCWDTTSSGCSTTSISISNSITNGVSFSPTVSNTYTVTATNAAGCLATNTVHVNVNATPTVTATATQSTICAGAMDTLTGGGASTYTWTGGVTNAVGFATPSTTTSYTLTGTDANGCKNTASKTITINALPTVTATATQSIICAGAIDTLTGGGASTYTWTGGVSNAFGFATPSTTTSYTVTGTDANGCKNTASKTITINAKPTVTATATTANFCMGAVAAMDTLTGGGANTYTWSGGISNGVGFATSSITTSYTVTGTDANGCKNTASTSISINALPNIPSITTVPSSPSICLGDSITINSGNNHALSFDGNVDYVNLGDMPQLSNTAHFTIECMVFANEVSYYKNIFSKKIDASNTIQLQFDQNLGNGQKLVVHIGDGVNDAEVYTNADFTTNTWHHVAAVYDGNGATNSDKVKIYVDGNLMPTSTFMSGIMPITTGTNTVPCLIGSENTSPSSFITFNGKLNDLRIWSTSRTAADIAASNNSCISDTTGLIAQYKFDESTGTSTANTLGSSYTGTLNNFSTPSCWDTTSSGCSTTSISISNSITNGVSFSPTVANTYTVTATNAAGCLATNTVHVNVNVKPTVTATATTANFCMGAVAAMDTLTGGGANTYTWTGGVTNAVGFATPSTTTSYTVTGTDANGCKNIASTSITINALPNIPSITTVPSSPSICLGDSITINSGNNHALSFDGNVDYVNLGDMPQLSNTAHFTIECMVFANVNSNFKNIFSKRVDPYNTIQLQFDDFAQANKLVVHIGDGVNNAEVYTNADFTTNIWHHVAVVYDGNGATNSDKVKIYVDGNLMPTSTYSSGIIPITTGTNTVPCLIGSENISPYPAIVFNGKLNDLRIWSTSRTAADIAASNNSCISDTTGLIAQYKFDESTGTSTANTLGSSNTGTLNNFSTPSCWVTTSSGCDTTSISISNSITNGVSFSPTVANTYTVTATNAAGCLATNTVHVNINAKPTVTATASQSTICAGAMDTLTGGGAITYTWTGGVMDGIGFATPSTTTTTTTYTVTGTNANSCSNTASASITINALPIITSISATPSTICAGDTSKLKLNLGVTNYSVASIPYSPIIPVGTTNLGPTGDDVVSSAIPIGFSFTFYNHTYTDFYISTNGFITFNPNSYTGCCSGDILPNNSLDVNNLIALSWTDLASYGGTTDSIDYFNLSSPNRLVVRYNNVDNLNSLTNTTGEIILYENGNIETHLASAGGSGSNNITNGLEDSTATLATTPANRNGVYWTVSNESWLFAHITNNTYTWLPNNNLLSPTADSTKAYPTSTTTYTVTASNPAGCTAVDSVKVMVKAKPSVTATPSSATTCFQSIASLSGGGAASYVWSNSITDTIPFVDSATATYTVTGTDTNGCKNTASTTITVNPISTDLALSTGGNASSMAGNVAQSQNQIDGSTVTYTDITNCSLIAKIDDGMGGNVLGNTTANVTVEATVPSMGTQPYSPRWFDIVPTNQGSATVTLYQTQADFDLFNLSRGAYPALPTSATDATGIANLYVTEEHAGGTRQLITPTAVSFNSANNYWEISVPVDSFSKFYVHTKLINAPLSITLKDFAVAKQATSDLVTWTTASEQNNKLFTVQKSTDAIHFDNIGYVNSQATNGTSTQDLNYSFVDSKPSNGINYYRLQQSDLSGKTSIASEVKSVVWNTNVNVATVYPNPATTVLNIAIMASQEAKCNIKLMDISGNVVAEQNNLLTKGNNISTINIENLANGIYTLQFMENGHVNQVSKVVKQD